MPKGGARPGERRGGRKKGTPNAPIPLKVRQKLSQIAKFEADVKRVLEEYGMIAGLDIRDAFEADGSLKPLNEWPEAVARCVSAMEVLEMGDDGGRFRLHKVKFHSKLHALDSIGKHLGMFVERSESTALSKAIVEHRIVFAQPDGRLLSTKTEVPV